MFGQSIFLCCCGWFWCGLVFCVVRFCLFVVCMRCCVLFCVVVVCFCVVVVLCCCVVVVCVVGVLKAPPPDPPPLDRPPLDRPKFRSFFSLSRRKIRSFLPSLGVFSLNFGVFEDRDPQMCTFGLSGCRVEPRRPHQTGPPGLHTTTRELQTRTFERPDASNTTRIPRKRPKEREKRTENCGGESEKKEQNFGPPPFGPPTVRAPHPSGPPQLRGPTTSGPHNFGPPLFPGLAPHPLGPHHDTKNIGQKIGLAKKLDWPKLALATIGRAKTTMAKNGLAKTGLAKVGLFRAYSSLSAGLNVTSRDQVAMAAS